MAPEDTPKVDPFEELGNRQLVKGRDYDTLEFLPQLRGRRGAEVYREMADNDALCAAILFAIEMILRRVEWNAEPFSGEQIDVDRADFLASNMDDMSGTWEDLIADALTMLPFGHADMEIVYKRRETTEIDADGERRTKYPDGKVGWRKFVLIPQETIDDYVLDEHGGVRVIKQGGHYGTQSVTIPIEKAVRFQTSKRSPRGKSVLRRVVESWYYRKRIREIEGIGISRDLEGLPVMHVAVEQLANPARKTEYQNIVRNLRRDEQEGVLLPATKDENGKLEPIADLKLISSGSSRQFDTSGIIQRYGREIAVALLQDVVLLGHEKVGTQALASEKRDLSDTALQTWLNHIAAVLNQYAVPRLFALNGESLENLPKIVPGELRPTDVVEFAAAIRDIASGGWVFTDDEDVEAVIRKRLGLPPKPPEELDDREPDETDQVDEAPGDEPPPPDGTAEDEAGVAA